MDGRVCWLVFFFFQAEDGIRDLTVTGVQTCALPISPPSPAAVGPLLVAGLGGGMVTSPNMTLTLQNVPVRMDGAAGGAVQTAQRIGAGDREGGGEGKRGEIGGGRIVKKKKTQIAAVG